MAICFPSSAPRAWRDNEIPSGPEFLLNLFPVFLSSEADQILSLEFLKDDPADIWDKFTYGGLANQPITLMTGTFLELPGVQVLLPVSMQFLRTF